MKLDSTFFLNYTSNFKNGYFDEQGGKIYFLLSLLLTNSSFKPLGTCEMVLLSNFLDDGVSECILGNLV